MRETGPLHYIVRNVFARKLRTALSLSGVAVAIASIVAMISVGLGMRESITVYFAKTGASLVVFDREVADAGLSRVHAPEIEAIRGVPGVAAIARTNFTLLMQPRLAATNGTAKFLPLFGRLYDEPLIEVYRSSLKEGRLPRAKHELLVGAIAAGQARIEVGDRFPLFNEPYGGVEQYEVVGVFSSSVNWESLGAVIDATIIQEQLAAGDAFNIVLVYTDGGISDDRLEEIRRAIEATTPRLAATRVDEVDEHYESQVEYIDHFIAIISFIAVVIGVLGVANTMMMSVNERAREIGTLRALGWSRGRVVRVIAAEGLLISVLGGLVGIGLGVAGAELTVDVLFPEAALQAAYRLGTMVKGFTVAVIVGLLGAAYPALRAASLRPAEALRHE